jgi:hypothetical protein
LAGLLVPRPQYSAADDKAFFAEIVALPVAHIAAAMLFLMLRSAANREALIALLKLQGA